MKRVMVLMVLVLLLSGCSNDTELETVASPCIGEPTVEPADVSLTLPLWMPEPVLYDDLTGELYICEDFSVSVQTLDGGNLDQTVHDSTGFGINELTVIETDHNGVSRYDLACTVTGEESDQVVRVAIFDDGVYHYVVTAMAKASNAGAHTETWNDIFSSIEISTAP